ncbi:hypothetical protein TNCV_3656101 [Trichonephila clavipes]|nr:hypothetical protein TNCV_3656101 [Trichonephila clavipes]
MWGYVKSLVYADKPQTLDYLEDNIRRVIADIRPQMLQRVIENWTSKLDYIRASRGSHMPEIIFKIKQIQIGLPDLLHLSIWKENAWHERRQIRQINQKLYSTSFEMSLLSEDYGTVLLTPE